MKFFLNIIFLLVVFSTSQVIFGISIDVQSVYHHATVQDLSENSPVNNQEEKYSYTEANAAFLGGLAHSEISFDGSVYEHKNLSVKISQYSAENPRMRSIAWTTFQFVLSEEVDYEVSGYFQGSVNATALDPVPPYYKSTSIEATYHAALRSNNGLNTYFEETVYTYLETGNSNFNYIIDGLDPNDSNIRDLQSFQIGSITGTLLPGAYSFTSSIALDANGDGSGDGEFKLKFFETSSTVPQNVNTFFILSPALLILGLLFKTGK